VSRCLRVGEARDEDYSGVTMDNLWVWLKVFDVT